MKQISINGQQRQKFTLNARQIEQLRTITLQSQHDRDGNRAREWWHGIAALHGLRHDSIIASWGSMANWEFSGLPAAQAQGVCWCAPLALKCQTSPTQVIIHQGTR